MANIILIKINLSDMNHLECDLVVCDSFKSTTKCNCVTSINKLEQYHSHLKKIEKSTRQHLRRPSLVAILR